MLSGTYERMTARTVSVEMHFNIPCSSASDMPNVDFPVPGQPLIKISFGGSFPFFSGGGELKVSRCFIDACTDVSARPGDADCDCGARGDGLKPDAEAARQHAMRR